MSFKFNGNTVNAIVYNGQDVKRVVYNGSNAWCKPFTYTRGNLPTGVSSLTCVRSSTMEPTASTGTINNGDTIYYGDTLYWTASASTGYSVSVSHGSSSPVTVTGDINGVSSSGVSASVNSYPVTISASNCKSVYLSTNSSATSGSASGTYFNYGSTVYGFATLNDDTAQYVYSAPSSWVLISGRTYRIGSLTVNTSGNSISGSANVSTATHYITVTGSWCSITVGGTTRSSGWSGTVNYGTSIVWTADSNHSFGGSSAGDTRSATVTGAGTYSNTPSYVKITVEYGNCSVTVGGSSVSSGWSGFLSEGVVISATPNSYFSFDEGSSQTGWSGVVHIDTNNYSNYFEIYPSAIKVGAVNGTNCTSNVNTNYYYDAYSVNNEWSVYQLKWTANSGYQFTGGATTLNIMGFSAGETLTATATSAASWHTVITATTGRIVSTTYWTRTLNGYWTQYRYKDTFTKVTSNNIKGTLRSGSKVGYSTSTARITTSTNITLTTSWTSLGYDGDDLYEARIDQDSAGNVIVYVRYTDYEGYENEAYFIGVNSIVTVQLYY